ncbi:acylphosphatase [Methylosoma difficile]
MRRFKILVSGRVQGVYFRAFTQKEALRMGVKGQVQNLPDKRVEIIAEAEDEVMDKFIAWCHKGPITARVDLVEVIEQAITQAFTSFEVVK